MLLKSRELKFLKTYRNAYGKSSAKREYCHENVGLSKLITLLISNKEEFNYFLFCCSDKTRNPEIFSKFKQIFKKLTFSFLTALILF